MQHSRLCRSVTPDWLLLAEIIIASAAGVAGIVCAATKQWLPAFILLAGATLAGVHADGSLRVRLATGACDNKQVVFVLLFVEVWTAIVILSWLAACIWLATISRLRGGATYRP